MLSLKTLKEELNKIILNNKINMKLIQHCRRTFADKGMDVCIPSQVFKGNYELEDLTKNELIALTISCGEFLQYPYLSLDKYFSDAEITDYKIYEEIQEENTEKNYLNVENTIKINNTEYITKLDASQLSAMMDNRMLMYYKGIQRATKKIKLKNGTTIEKINANIDGITSLEARFLKNDIAPTQISLVLLLFEDKKVSYKFTSYTKEHPDCGSFEAILNFDPEDEAYFPLIIADGYHRLRGLLNAYKKNSEKVKSQCLSVAIHLLNVPQAKMLVADSFERNETEKEYLPTLKNTDDNKLVNELLVHSAVLAGSIICDTESDFKKNLNALTWKGSLINAIKKAKVSYSNNVEILRSSMYLSESLDTTLNYINDTYSELYNREGLLFKNSFIGYIAIIQELKGDKTSALTIGTVIDNIVSANEFDKLAKMNENEVYEYFMNILNGVR